DRKAVFVCEKPVSLTNDIFWRIGMRQNHGGWNSDDHMNNNLGRFRISATSNANAQADPLPKRVSDVLSIPRDKRNSPQVATVFSYWRTTVPAFKETNEKIDTLWSQWPNGTSTLTLMARATARETHILKRGDWLKPA